MDKRRNHPILVTILISILAIVGCNGEENAVEMLQGGDDTVMGGDDTAMGGDDTAMGGDDTAMGGDDTAMGGDDTAMGGDDTAMGGSAGMASTCERLSTDYPGSSWAECLVDDGTYRLAGESAPSSIARVAAFDIIADYLWRGTSVPSAEDFLNARIEYELDEGLASRVTRRYDAHVEQPADGVSCRGETDAADYPEYCVGPASMHPLITNAFVAGSTGETPEVNAAKVEAGLLWFMYVSTHKEGYSCKGKAKDCDSAWAYYGAQETVDGAVGLARYVRDVSVEHHQDIFNAILAIRCWRESDSGETAIDDELHAQVLTQLDRALDRGIGQILMNRMERLRTESSAEAEASKALFGYSWSHDTQSHFGFRCSTGR